MRTTIALLLASIFFLFFQFQPALAGIEVAPKCDTVAAGILGPRYTVLEEVPLITGDEQAAIERYGKRNGFLTNRANYVRFSEPLVRVTTFFWTKQDGERLPDGIAVLFGCGEVTRSYLVRESAKK